jgi:hypothetical protein
MIRRSRDAKFIIYQVLYIFVITVLALKGAEINLGEVVKKENVVEKSVRDSLINVVDSLSKLGLKFNIEVDPNVVTENKMLKNKLNELNTQVASLNNKINILPKPDKKETSEKIKTNLPSPFSTSKSFLQFASNTAENQSNITVEIRDIKTNSLLATIPPNGSKVFELSNQSEVLLKYGGQEEIVKVKPNLPPDIIIEKVTTKMDKSNIYVKELQRSTCFNVKISDERLEQIKINYSGPVSVSKPMKDKRGDLIYTVSLNLVSNEDKFYDWIDKNNAEQDSDGRYKVNFFFSAYDTKSKQKVEVGDSFLFTDFSK